MHRIIRFFSSSVLALMLLLAYAVAMAVATFVENDFGTATAWAVVYNAWWFELIMLGLGLCFIANIEKYKLTRREKWPLLLFHIAFVIILIGAGITRHYSYGGIMRIREGMTSSTIISSDNYLTANISNGEITKRVVKKMAFSPLKNNDFKINTDINGEAVDIYYKEFIADAIPEVVRDEENGEPLLELVVSAGEGKQTIFMRDGEVEMLGQEKIGLNAPEFQGISITREDDEFWIKAPRQLDFFIMASQEAGVLSKDSLHRMKLRTLYRLGDVSFVARNYYEYGDFELVSGAENYKDNDAQKDDAVKVAVQVNGKEKEDHLLYREGYLPTSHSYDMGDIKVDLSYGSIPIMLPFEIKLNDFQLERYPGSSSPSAYASEVSVLDKGTEMPHRIFMNNVLDYGGFRFFQASYDTDELGTVLAVNHDRVGTLISYLGYFLMGLGMLWTLFGKRSRFQYLNQKMKKIKSNAGMLLFFLVASSALCFAQEDNMHDDLAIKIQSQELLPELTDDFGRLLVQDLDGRIKPVNSLASEFIRKISRKPYYQYPTRFGKVRYDANQTFMAMHISPDVWSYLPIIKIDTEKTQDLLSHLEVGDNGLYAFNQLLDSVGAYILTEAVEEANRKKPSERNEMDKEVLKVDERFNILYNLFIGNYLKIFPKKGDENNTWFSYNHHFTDFTHEDGQFAKGILPAYFKDVLNRDIDAASEKYRYIKKYQEILAADIIPSQRRIDAELLYNKMNMNFWLFQILFTIGFVMLILAVVRMFSSAKAIQFLWKLLLVVTVVIFIAFAANICLRWYVAQHAPWSNGYEMLVFVSWVLLLSGLLTYKRSDFALPLATLFTGALLFVSYLDWLSPDITNLMPVLKSYWLKIHVATIVSSYAPLALSAVLGLMALLLIVFRSDNTKEVFDLKIKEISYLNEMSMTIGLFTLAIGTFLGGVWANESWGRYWAWDPKETWALISIIVYAIVLHLRFVPKLNNFFVLNAASMLAFWSIIMTSFGVNYYLSGLHSYASGDPMPIPKFVYFLAVFMIVLVIVARVRWNKKKVSNK